MTIGAVVGALFLGFLAGLWTFKVKTRWCTTCGTTLACVTCLVRHGQLAAPTTTTVKRGGPGWYARP
ncbi:hypothetical protein GCM10022225_78850 [Plantactinospora mayteni]|uniref:Uncharacterized protein n=1 Tax=Plantactinospora mayteni TaxID=566021 RepID=A0ABQ4F2Z2_9ACTN|nr:hypothetical protein [Plantactinospora mayteni]GIH01265.1 hypothetical protein Pma05_78370 [Plantactinospora mayteni]